MFEPPEFIWGFIIFIYLCFMDEKEILRLLVCASPLILGLIFFCGWAVGRYDGIRWMMKKDEKFWEDR